MIELYVYSTKMSPENRDVFQLLKEVTFRRILAFFQLARMGAFWWHLCMAQCALIGWWDWSESF